uniref:Putative cuticular protein rr-2 motif 92 n=1 Tax=Nyssomyia neivai TaxID=330878 RepID=A0A1L8E496_9DIPT
MFKIFVLATILGLAAAAPAPGVVVASPVVHHTPVVAHAVHPVAVSHSSSHVVHHPAVVKSVHVAHAPLVHAPLVHAPVVHAHPVVKTVSVHPAPVVAHHAVVHPVHAVHHAAPVLVHH